MMIVFPSLIFIPLTDSTKDSQYMPIYSNDSILIDTNDDFTANGFSGAGTENNPFLLEGQDIDSYLSIRNTTAFFVIRNCRMLDYVSFDWLSNGVIENCVIDANISIRIVCAWDIIIRENTFNPSSRSESLELFYTENCSIIHNYFLECNVGLRLLISNHTIVADNYFFKNNRGFDLTSSANTTVSGNNFIDNGLEIRLTGAGACGQTYSGDEFVNVPYNISHNLVNGREIGFFHNESDIEVNLDQYGQVILLNCNDTTIFSGTFRKCTIGVQISYCNNCTIRDVAVFDCYWNGIDIWKSTNIAVQDCSISRCSNIGLFLSQSPFFTILSCVIEDNLDDGINPHIYSNNGTVKDCVIRRNHRTGLYLSENATAVSNNVTRNYTGISIYGKNCLVVNNTVTHNNSTGIWIGNYLSGYEGPPYNNRIYGNDIGWNGYYNAIDHGYSNHWDDGEGIGNSWSDYYGIGVYEIDWWGIDHYPNILPRGNITPFQIHLVIAITLTGVVVLVVIMILRKRK
jgi:parallel beta-helix repeat protein